MVDSLREEYDMVGRALLRAVVEGDASSIRSLGEWRVRLRMSLWARGVTSSGGCVPSRMG